MRGLSPLEQSQKKLYLAVKKELALFEKKKNKDIIAYERSFRAAFPEKIRPSDRRRLFDAMEKASVVLVGDFHPFRQSQKGFLRLIEGSSHFLSPGTAIALECLSQSHQTAVNEYLKGLITVEELRDKIDFERYWPFSWESYREILAYARQNHFAVLSLNIAGRGERGSELRTRDQAATVRIAQHLEKNPGSKVFALYGELHLGRKHLPADLRKALPRTARIVTVHQNDVDLYWRAAPLADGQRPEVLELGTNEFCILNSVPWVKLRSFLDWLEGSPSSNFDEGEVDVAESIPHYAKLLGQAIGLKTSIDSNVEILPPDHLGYSGQSSRLRSLKSPDKELSRHALGFHRVGYLPIRAALIVPVVSTNSMAEAASLLLRHSSRSPAISSKWGREEWISLFFIGYLGSKILNPKRKCNEVADLRRVGGQVAKRALALLRPYLKDAETARAKRLPTIREIEACRMAGYILGERFFLALLASPSLIDRLRKIFQKPLGGDILKEATAGIAKLRRKSKSKNERF